MTQNSEFNERLSILTSSEREIIYGLPKLTNLERKHLFDLEKIEEDIVYEKLSGINSRVYFILQLGYFKFSHKFFKFNFNEVLEDVEYILEKYFPNNTIDDLGTACNKKARLNHHSIILKLFSSRFPTKEDNENLFKKAKSVVSIDANPKYIFKEIVRFISDNKIILPAYSTIQKLISKAMIASDQEMFANLKNLIDDDLIKNINDLLIKESKFRYQLTLIKAPPQNFSKKQATTERNKQEQLEPIFMKAKVILKKLNYRQNIQIALNRGESYHQLAGNVSYANGGKIISKKEREQLIFKECARLVCNIIIYYNSQILSQFYLEKQRLNQNRQIKALERVSPIAWTHINIMGKYHFRKMSIPMSFSNIIELVKDDILIDEGLVGGNSVEMAL